MNCYEHTFILRQDLSEVQSRKIIEKYQNIITKNSGKVLKTEEWGLRNLTYEIKKNKKGFYFHIKFEGDGITIEKLEKEENIDDAMTLYDIYYTEIGKILNKYKENIYLLKYEDIILNPESTLIEVFNFCNLDSSSIKLPEVINKDRLYAYKKEKIKFDSEKYGNNLSKYEYSL